MTPDEVEELLKEALAMRCPVRDPDGSARAHVERLENHMLASAHVGGSLIEARDALRRLEAQLEAEWEAMTGWETATTKPRTKLSKQDIHEAKLKTAPAKYEVLARCRLLRAGVDDQYQRLDREATICSRAYTMATGG